MSLPNMAAIQSSWSFDISWVDQAHHLYYLADRTSKGVDVFDLQSRKFVTTIGGFIGISGGTKGPNGVVTDSLGQLWAADGDSSVKVVSLSTRQIVARVSTGGKERADELAYDAQDQLIAVGNGDDSPPFLTLISASSHKVVKKITLSTADGIEQPAWDATTDDFDVSVPETSANAGGEIDVIDPVQGKVVKVVPLKSCNPSGFAIGPSHEAIIGCDGDPVVLSLTTWQVLAMITQASGCDEVWYDSGSQQYFLAAGDNPGGSVLAVVDAKTLKWVQNIRTKTDSHSVAADNSMNIVLVPEVGLGIVIYG